MRLDVIMKYVNARMAVLEAAQDVGESNYCAYSDKIDAQVNAHLELDKMLREEIAARKKVTR